MTKPGGRTAAGLMLPRRLERPAPAPYLTSRLFPSRFVVGFTL